MKSKGLWNKIEKINSLQESIIIQAIAGIDVSEEQEELRVLRSNLYAMCFPKWRTEKTPKEFCIDRIEFNDPVHQC